MKSQYKIIKVFNNNVILASSSYSNEEMVIVGKGIGFGKKENVVVDIPEEKIEKSYKAYDSSSKEEYIRLVSQIDRNVMGVGEEIISMAESALGPLNMLIHTVLIDHISFAIERIKLGMEINNPFLFEIKMFYPEEFKVAELAGKMIKDRLGIDIVAEEAGFIALHLHSARQNKPVKETVKNTQLLKELVEIIEGEVGYSIPREGMMYIRVINHLKGMLSRSDTEKGIKNEILKTVKSKFKASYKTAEKLREHIKERKEMYISDDELGYLALHIERIKEIKKMEEF